MKKALFMLSMAAAMTVSATAHADSTKPVALWLCSDYLAVDQSFQPTALGFAEAINRKGKPEAEALDIQGIAKVQPEVLTYCKENPKIALRDALVQSWTKIRK